METRRLSFEKNPLVPELKDVPAEAKVERLSLPEDIEREISEIPLQRIVERCRAAGVEEDKLEAYKAAFVALLDRPSLAINISSRNGRLNFLPQEYYFAPQVEFGRSGFMSSSYNIPDLLGGGMYKLRAKKSLDGQPDTNPSHHYTEPTGIELLQKFESQGAENQQKKLNGIERYLVRVNRLMYRLHEPFHILQGLVAGDLLNVYKHRFGAEDLVDPQKESELIQAQGQAEDAALAAAALPGFHRRGGQRESVSA